MVRTLAQLTGHKLVEFPVNSDTDTMEIVGSFQQVCNILCDVWLVTVFCLDQVNLSRHYCNIATMCKAVVVGLLDTLRANAEIAKYEEYLSKVSVELSSGYSPASTLESVCKILSGSVMFHSV